MIISSSQLKLWTIHACVVHQKLSSGSQKKENLVEDKGKSTILSTIRNILKTVDTNPSTCTSLEISDIRNASKTTLSIFTHPGNTMIRSLLYILQSRISLFCKKRDE
ncbi:hypothetical protein OnM2_089018 [Erysiphe neolycopersici]|uniref:Uncharacterized protein n=1 Tax=Erysiphe neolycopersici TaxID=212602 RepID=A0A420HDA8_9PEZI|nr:hypothetical protein OnM2_089018 [Erysiphe neolycopersici]